MTSSVSVVPFHVPIAVLLFLLTAWTAQAADNNSTATVAVTESQSTTAPNSTNTTEATLPAETDAPKASLPLEPWLIALICFVVLLVFGMSIWAAARQRLKKQRGKREVERVKAEDAYKVRMEKMSKTIDRL